MLVKNRYLHSFLAVLFLLISLSVSSLVSADTPLISGVQVPSEKSISRLTDSKNNFESIKLQYNMGGSMPLNLSTLELWVTNTHNGGYSSLISIAKQYPSIQNLGAPSDHGKYCPYDNELDQTEWFEWQKTGTRPTGCYEDPVTGWHCTGTEDVYGWVRQTGTEGFNKNNGYVQFRDAMTALINTLKTDARNKGLTEDTFLPEAIEIWNEPNLAIEWSALGQVNPDNYAQFLICGIKGLRKAGYNGVIISAGLAPIPGITGFDGTNWEDKDFFYKYYDDTRATIAKYDNNKHGSEYDHSYNYQICRTNPGGERKCVWQKYNSSEIYTLSDFNVVGWHSNVVDNIPPNATYAQKPFGFQRVQIAIDKTDKPIWLTEYGWERDNSAHPNGIDKELQGEYIVQAGLVAEGLDKVHAMYIFNFGFTKDGYRGSSDYQQMTYWDIEGTTIDTNIDPEGRQCGQPALDNEYIGLKDLNYLTAPTHSDDTTIALMQVNYTTPLKSSVSDLALQMKNNEPSDRPQTDLFAGLIENFKQFFAKIICSLGVSQYCTADTVIGTTWRSGVQSNPVTTSPNPPPAPVTTTEQQYETELTVASSQTLNFSNIPDITLIPRSRDCRIVGDSTDIQITRSYINQNVLGADNRATGNAKLNILSTSMGTNAGFYGVHTPPLQGEEQCIKDRKTAPNADLVISGNQLTGDSRQPDIDCKQNIYYQSWFPSGITPQKKQTPGSQPNL